MTDITWPNKLINSLESAKRVNRGAGWTESPVASGPSFVERYSDDEPTFFDVGFTFTRNQARVFDSWLQFHNMQTEAPFFNFPVKIPDTNQAFQVVRFVDNVPQRVSQNGDSFSYSGQIMARSISSPDLDYPEAILALFEITDNGDINQGAEFLDTAINISAPTV